MITNYQQELFAKMSKLPILCLLVSLLLKPNIKSELIHPFQCKPIRIDIDCFFSSLESTMINFFAVTSDAIEYLILSLYIACHEGYLDIVKLLIERSADVIISIIA